MFIFT